MFAHRGDNISTLGQRVPDSAGSAASLATPGRVFGRRDAHRPDSVGAGCSSTAWGSSMSVRSTPFVQDGATGRRVTPWWLAYLLVFLVLIIGV